MGAVFLLDADGECLIPLVTMGLPGHIVRACDPLQIASGAIGRAVRQLEPVIVADVQTSPNPDARVMAADDGIRAFFAVPVPAADGRALGVLVLHFATPFVPVEQDLVRTQSFAKLIAAVLESHAAADEATRAKAHLHGMVENLTEDLHQAETEQRLVGDVAYTLAASLDYEQTLTQTAKLAVDAFADWACVDLAQPDGTIKRVAVVHRDPAKADLAVRVQACDIPPDEDSDIPHVIRTGDARLITGADAALLRQRGNASVRVEIAVALGIRSYVIVPLQARGRILGALSFIRGDGQPPYDDHALAVCRQIADRAAVAIDNARLYAEAKHAVQQRQRLLTIVSHDLRNLVAAAMMNVAATLKFWPSLGPAALEKALQIGQHMERLIGELLDSGSIEAGQFSIRPVSLDAAALVRDAVDGCRPFAIEKGLSLTINVPTAPSMVSADRDRLHQALANLLGNAIKFTPAGGHLTVDATPVDDSIRITIRDSGPGIPAAHLPHLFEPFWQADSTAHLGTGLGLSIARDVVQAHGGRIWAESDVGEGCAIVFTLPFAAGSR